MNEPSNFIHGRPEGCADDLWNKPLYVPGKQLLYTNDYDFLATDITALYDT